MNRFKKILALFLVLCMSITMVPTNTFASESTVLTEETVESGDSVEEKIFEETPDEENAEQIPTETEQTVGDNVETEVIEDKAVQAGVELTSVEDEAADIETDAPEKSSENGNTEIMTADLDDAEVAVSSLTLGTKPEDGTVSGDPFNESVSKNYRIPGLVTLNDGTLIASADARWDYEKDGGGMDLVVSRSTDGGTTWNYTFAGYLGDNGNKWDPSSSTLMDPAIISDGKTLYLLADIFPAGYSLSTGNTDNAFNGAETGYTSSGCLQLSNDNRQSYGYYLKDGAIYTSDNEKVSGYSVDGWFNLYQGNTYVTNLFFEDSPYQLYPTSYISIQASTDSGKNWSDPTLLNIKPSGVNWMVLGPGAGLVNTDGDLAFTTYDNSNIYLIWGSPENGWNRVSTSAATNESSIVELPDGTIRAFVKRSGSNTIAYVDFTKSNSGYTAGELVDTGVANFSNCMVSSLFYSKTYNGKEVVLVCCPSKSSGGTWAGRFNGTIYAFTLDDSNNMTLLDRYQVNNSFFAYSNMVELEDGSIGLLYEDDCISYAAGNYSGDASHITYTNVDLESALGITFDEVVDEDIFYFESSEKDGAVLVPSTAGVVRITAEPTTVEGLTERYVAYDINLYTNNGKYTEDARVTLPLNGEFGANDNLRGFVVNADGTIEYIDNVERDSEADTVTFTVPHFSSVGVTAVADYISEKNVELYIGETTTITDETGNYEADYTGTGLDVSTAEVTVEGTTVKDSVTMTPVGTMVAEATFYIQVNEGEYRTAKAGTTKNLEEAEIWTVNYANPYYCTICNSEREYLGVGYDGVPYVKQSTSYLKMVDGKLVGYYSGHEAGMPMKITGTQAVNKTDITITGLSKGNTSVVVGTTKYNITVKTYEASLHTYKGMSKIISVAGTVTEEAIAAFNSAYGATVTVAMADGNLTFTGVGKGQVKAVLGNTEYTITVSDGVTAGNIADFNNIVGEDQYTDSNSNAQYRSDLDMAGKAIKKLTISENVSFNLNVDVSEYESVEWSVADSSVATVDSNGVVTGLKNGTTTVTAAVIKNGKMEAITIPVVVNESLLNGGDTANSILYYIEQIDNTIPYYTMFLSSNGKTPVYELVPVEEGEVICLERPANTAFAWLWTAAPYDDHALALMGSSGTINEYYPLRNSDGTLGDGYVDADDNGEFTDGETQYYYTSSNFTTNGKPNNAYKNVVLVGNDARVNWRDSFNSILNKSLTEDYGCDGALSSTRWDHDGVPTMVTAMTFISDPVPTIDKTVDGILPTTRKQADYRKYTDGMIAGVDELVYFKITVSLKRPTVWADEENGIGAITYSNALVSDTVLSDAYFYNKNIDTNLNGTIEDSEGEKLQSQEITDQLNKAWEADEEVRTIEFYLVYQIKTEDIPKFTINNIADLNTEYQSKYSTGASTREADALASITVVGLTMDNVVIDFGQKVTIKGLTDEHLKGVYIGSDLKYSAQYGEVELKAETNNTYTVTYTPTEILQKPDVVYLYGLGLNDQNKEVEKIINGFVVYPATTVHYEEGFLFNDKSKDWDVTEAKKATMEQTFEYLGESQYDNNGTLTGYVSDKKHEYGYDPIYDNSNTYSAGSFATTSIMGATTSFEITGTGLEVFADCTEETGYVSVMIQNSAGKTVKFYMVNTAALNGTTDATNNQEGKFYGTPIVSVDGLSHDTYTVTLTKIMESDKPVYIDGIRVFNTVEDSSIYAIDLEDNPEYYQLRDVVLKALSVDSVTASEYGSISEMAKQVYAGITEDSEQPAVILTNSAYPEDISVQDLLDNGPKNELFLRGGQTLVFRVETSRLMQLGLSAPAGETAYTVTTKYTDETERTIGGEEKTLKSSVDMFYELGNPNGKEYTYTVTVTNNGGNILSVTDLKICDDPNAAFSNLTEKDVEYALVAMGYEEEPVYADAVLNISLADTDGAVLAATSLTANGIVGETATFTAAAIEEEAASVLPEGYELKDAVYEDTAVAYGEETAVNFTAEEIVEEETDAIETIVTKIFSSIKNLFKKLFG